MKERPILFSGPMVRALLDGSKTQTRRIAKGVAAVHTRTGEALANADSVGPRVLCPYGQPGDRLWVREAWAQRGAWRLPEWPDADADDTYWHGSNEVIYTATTAKPATDWRGRPSIHMPRWASRILLEITDVRVERLNDISNSDAEAEGIDYIRQIPDADETLTAHELFEALWDANYGPGAWEENPWVWVIEFKKVNP